MKIKDTGISILFQFGCKIFHEFVEHRPCTHSLGTERFRQFYIAIYSGPSEL